MIKIVYQKKHFFASKSINNHKMAVTILEWGAYRLTILVEIWAYHSATGDSQQSNILYPRPLLNFKQYAQSAGPSDLEREA